MTASQDPRRGSGLEAAFAAVFAISLGISLLMLASPLYMLQVFDRVLSGRSLETLLFLTIAVALALGAMGGLDICRAVILARFADWLERRIAPSVLRGTLRLSAHPGAVASDLPMSDMTVVRQFLSSPGAGALFDAPMMPLFIAVIYVIHPVLGLVAISSALLLALLAVAIELLSRRQTVAITPLSSHNAVLTGSLIGNADLVQTMGLSQGLLRRWLERHAAIGDRLLASTTAVGALSAASKAIRLGVQSAILGAGAILVLGRDITPGEMIACSILLSRALAPLETAIGTWRHLVSARQAWRRLQGLIRGAARREEGQALPVTAGEIALERVTLAGRPGMEPLLSHVTFVLPAGAALGVIGGSGAGKTSLVRLIAGAWWPTAGTVRIDGADLRNWDPDQLGRQIGYLPQGADLFPGSVQDNIARFGDPDFDRVLEAARIAGAHETILTIPGGYGAQVGARGEMLSGGQRQRVAMARAVYGSPRLVILDEPDAHLDHSGHEALMRTIAELRRQRITLVIVAHRGKPLQHCDWLMQLEKGRVTAFGPSGTVAERLGLRASGRRLRAVKGGDDTP